jgi:Tfp pilus assembly protein PilV
VTRPALQRGSTLIESLVAMAVLMAGSMGLVALHGNGVRLETDSRKVTRATAIAQDLVNQMEYWAYDEAGRFKNVHAENDATLGDPGQLFETSSDPVGDKIADHGEADLTLGGATWTGLSAADVEGYERYWSVAYVDDSNGNTAWDAVRVAAVVRWRSGAGWRRVVMMMTKVNPAEVSQ